jgi:hypothetical protein
LKIFATEALLLRRGRVSPAQHCGRVFLVLHYPDESKGERL